jgi:hypothetical protein
VSSPCSAITTSIFTARSTTGTFGNRDSFVFLPRIQIAFAHMAVSLHATLPIPAILEDMDGIAEPTTELGKLHHAWVRERGLPSALDHHDHS